MSKYRPKNVKRLILSHDNGERARQRAKELVTEETLARGQRRRHFEDLRTAKELGISLQELQS